MKSLYNISGILPAQCRTNPNDCGISWNSHRRVEPVKRRCCIDQAEQGADQTAVADFRMKPIDPATIQVGDTVRLIGMKQRYEWAEIEIGQDYTVCQVDARQYGDGMKARISSPHGRVWIFDEDLMLVESA